MNLESEQAFDYQFITRLHKSGNVYRLPNGVSLRRRNIPTNNYQHSWDVWIHGICIGKLSTDCQLPQVKVTQRLTFENDILYTEPGWYHYLGMLTAATGLSCSSVSMLEIALDMQPKNSDSDARELLHELDKVYRYLPRKYSDDVRFRPVQGKLRIQEERGTYYFGNSITSSRSSGKQIAVYCKSDEIKQTGKNYISDFHSDNGLDSQRAILRIETKLTNKYLRNIDCFSVRNLLNPEFLKSTFVDAVGETFHFRDLSRPTRDGHRNIKYPIIKLATFDFPGQQPILRRQYPGKNENNDSTNICTVKRLTFEIIRHDAPETRAELLRFIQVNPAPKGKEWYRKISQYAHQYSGKPSEEQMLRINDIFLNGYR